MYIAVTVESYLTMSSDNSLYHIIHNDVVLQPISIKRRTLDHSEVVNMFPFEHVEERHIF